MAIGRESFWITTQSGINLEIDVIAYFEADHNYGADADGNRGWTAWFMTDIEFDIPDSLGEICDCDLCMGKSDHIFTPDEKSEIKELVQDAAENHDWEFDTE